MRHLPRLCSNDNRSRGKTLPGYWFGTCGVTGKVTPLVAGGVVGFAGVAGAPLPLGAAGAPLPLGAAGAALPEGAAGAAVPAGAVVPGNWLSTPLPALSEDAGTRSRMSIGFSP